MNYYLTTGTAPTTCAHESSTAARVVDDIASVWECDDCGFQTPFTPEDYAFVNACRWLAPDDRAFAFAR